MTSFTRVKHKVEKTKVKPVRDGYWKYSVLSKYTLQFGILGSDIKCVWPFKNSPTSPKKVFLSIG